AVLDSGLDQQRRARVALEVLHLLGLGVGPDPDLAVARHVPERHRVWPAPRADRGDDRDALALDQLRELLVRELDLLAPGGHQAGEMMSVSNGASPAID